MVIVWGNVASASLINRTPRTTLSSLQCPFWGSEKPINTYYAAPIPPLVRRSLSSMAAAFLRESPPRPSRGDSSKLRTAVLQSDKQEKNLSVIFMFSLCQNWISSLILMRLGSGGEAVSVGGPQHHITCCSSPRLSLVPMSGNTVKKVVLPSSDRL